MQIITSRQNRLLQFLLLRREYTTIAAIAGRLNVSEKTIQRDSRLLEQWLEQWGISVEKRVGAGVTSSVENATDLLHLDHLLMAEYEEIDGVMNNAKCTRITLQLLSETPNETSASKLSGRYFINGTSIVNNLRIIESWLAPSGLSSIRSPSGTYIEGNEGQVRQAMALLVNGTISHNEPQGVVYSRLGPGGHRILIHYFGEEEVLFVQSLLLDTENELSWSLGEPYHVNVFTHVLIVIYRNTYGDALSREEDQTRQYDESIFNAAGQMAHKIEQRVVHTSPDDGVWFIYQYIISSGTAIDG